MEPVEIVCEPFGLRQAWRDGDGYAAGAVVEQRAACERNGGEGAGAARQRRQSDSAPDGFHPGEEARSENAERVFYAFLLHVSIIIPKIRVDL